MATRRPTAAVHIVAASICLAPSGEIYSGPLRSLRPEKILKLMFLASLRSGSSDRLGRTHSIGRQSVLIGHLQTDLQPGVSTELSI